MIMLAVHDDHLVQSWLYRGQNSVIISHTIVYTCLPTVPPLPANLSSYKPTPHHRMFALKAMILLLLSTWTIMSIAAPTNLEARQSVLCTSVQATIVCGAMNDALFLGGFGEPSLAVDSRFSKQITQFDTIVVMMINSSEL